MKRLLWLSLVAMAALCAEAQRVDNLLQQFDVKRDVVSANAFFSQLKEEEFIDEAVVFSPKTPADSLQQQVWYWAAEWLYHQQQYERSVTYGQKALPLFDVRLNPDGRADCLNILALAYLRLTDFDTAAGYAQQCCKLDQQSGDPDRISSSLNTLAGIYMAGHQPKEAEQYILKGIEQAQLADNPGRMAVLQGMASEVYHSLGRNEEALKYIDEAIRLEHQNGRSDRLPVRQAQRASVLIGLNRYDEAEQTLSEAIPLLRQNGNVHSLGIALNKMGSVMLCKQRKADAVPFFSEAADIFKRQGDPYNEVQSRRGLYDALWESNPDEAHRHHQRFDLLKDSIYDHTSAEMLSRYNAQFGNDWLLLENRSERQAKQRAILVGATASLLLLLLVGGVWWVMRRRHQRQSRINASLSADIEQLREKYQQLHISYDKAMLVQSAQSAEVTLTSADRDFLEEAVSVVNELITLGQIDAATVAQRLCMSPFQLRQRITSLTGETPQSFIQTLRMRRARHLLAAHTELNVTEVAMLCAYNDTPNFTRAFKRAFGLTPSQYVEQKRGE